MTVLITSVRMVSVWICIVNSATKIWDNDFVFSPTVAVY